MKFNKLLIFPVLLLMMVTLAFAITQTGFYGNFDKNVWDTGDSFEQVYFSGTSNYTTVLNGTDYAFINLNDTNLFTDNDFSTLMSVDDCNNPGVAYVNYTIPVGITNESLYESKVGGNWTIPDSCLQQSELQFVYTINKACPFGISNNRIDCWDGSAWTEVQSSILSASLYEEQMHWRYADTDQTFNIEMSKYSSVLNQSITLSTADDLINFTIDVGADGTIDYQTVNASSIENATVYFSFDNVELVTDLTDGQNNGTNNGATTGYTGILGEAFEFVPSDYVNFPLTYNGVDFAISYWFNTSTATTGTDYHLGGQSAGGNQVWCYDAGTLGCSVQANGDAGVGVSSGVNVQDGAWHHIVLNRLDNGTFEIYIDGVYKAELFNSANVFDYNTQFPIGSRFNGGYLDYTTGHYDEFIFFNENINNQTIQELYNGGAGARYDGIGSAGSMNGTITLTSLVNATNSYLNSCTHDGNGYCDVPYVFASDSVGWLNLTLDNMNYSMQYDFTYLNETWNGDSNVYEVIMYSENKTTLSPATFYFNDTSYTSTENSAPGYYGNYTYSMATPYLGLVNETSYLTPMYWNLTYNPYSEFTDTYNQTVHQISVADCADQPSWTPALNILTLDEEGNETEYVTTTINADFDVWHESISRYVNYSVRFEGGSNYSLCVSPNESIYIANAIMEYYGEDYANRKYYLNNYPLNGTGVTTLNLYNLNSSKASDITFYAYNSNTGEVVPDAYIQILRYYPELGEYRVVEIEKTDENGYALGKMVLADVFYKFVVTYNDVVVLNTDVQRILAYDKNLPIDLEDDVLASWREINNIYTLVQCNDTTATCSFDWLDNTGLVQYAMLKVYEINGFGRSVVYEETKTGASGSMNYIIPAPDNGTSYQAIGYIETNTENSFYTVGQDILAYRDDVSDRFGTLSLFPLLLLLLSLMGVATDIGSVGIVSVSLVVIIFAFAIGFIPISITSLMSLIIIGGLLIAKLKG